MNCVIYRKIC